MVTVILGETNKPMQFSPAAQKQSDISTATIPRANLLDVSREQIEQWVSEHNLPQFRTQQILHWRSKLVPFESMSDLPAELRNLLGESFDLSLPRLETTQGDDNIRKFLVRMPDLELVECVQIGHPKEYTACVSTQAGCRLACRFCASGKQGLERNLSSGEIVSQVLLMQQQLSKFPGIDGWPRHIVYMGMGEPFHNYSSTINSINTLLDPEGINFGSRRITISTAGVVPEIYRFAKEQMQTGLAVSLHAPNSELRRSLMPIEEIYPLSSLLRACRYYIENTRRRLTFEYILLSGINDSPREAKRLAHLFKDWQRIHVNLIRYNPTGPTRLKSPSVHEARGFLKRLQDQGLAATLRNSPGTQIDAACGQLRLRHKTHTTKDLE